MIRTPLTLKVVIVGAGIAGMAAAVGCGLAGHEVLVLEGASAIGDVGAGLQVAPNMMRILERWGLRQVVVDHSVSLSSVEIRRWQSGELLGVTPISKAWGEQYVIHRADLHRALYDRAAALPNVRVQTKSTVVSVDFDWAAVEVKGRGWIKADVVLGADGIKSRIRKQLLGDEEDVVIPTGDAAYRFVLPRAAMEKDPELRELIDRPGGTRWVGPGRHVMAYPIKRHQLYNMVLLHPDVMDSEESWTAMGSKEEMLAMYEGWEPLLQKLLRLVDSETVLEWKLCSHESLDTWTRGNVALLGDACHPMLPYVAQGAAQAVEDAATIAVLLSDVYSKGDIPQTLRFYETARKSRAEAIQDTANENRDSLHLPDGEEQRARDEKFSRIFMGGENPDRWGDPTHQNFLWGWDAEKAIKDVMNTKKLPIKWAVRSRL